MVASGGESSREVVIMLRTEVDRKSSSAALREQAKLVKDAQAQATAAVKESSRDMAKAQGDRMRMAVGFAKQQERESVKAVKDADKARKEIERDQTRRQSQQNRRTVAILKQQERDAVKAAKNADREKAAIEKAAASRQREQNRRTVAILKQQEQDAVLSERGKQAAIKGTEIAQRQALSAHQQATAQLTGMNERATEGFKMSLSGAMSLGRGIAMLGLVGEKDTQKLLEGLIKIQAAFDIMRGSIETVQGLTRAWTAYRSAVAAAAAARTTLTAAQAAGAATGAAGIAGAGGIGLVAGAGLLAAGGAYLGGRAISETVTAVSKYGVGGGADVGSQLDVTGSGLHSAYRWLQRQGVISGGVELLEAAAFTPLGVDAGSEKDPYFTSQEQAERAERNLKGVRAERARREKSAGGFFQAQRAAEQARRRVTPLTRSQAQANLAKSRARVGGLRVLREDLPEGEEAPLTAEIEDADQRHKAALQDVIALAERERAIRQQTGREQIALADRRIASLRTVHAQHIQTAKLIREQGLAAKERFGALGGREQAELVRISRKIKTGEELTRKEETLIEPFREITQLGRGIRAGRFRRAEAGGFEEFAGGDFERRVDIEQRAERSIETKINLLKEHKITVRMDTKTVVAALDLQIRKAGEEIVEKFEAELAKVGESLGFTVDENATRIDRLENLNLQEAGP